MAVGEEVIGRLRINGCLFLEKGLEGPHGLRLCCGMDEEKHIHVCMCNRSNAHHTHDTP